MSAGEINKNMAFEDLLKKKGLHLFVKEIFILESNDEGQEHQLPFFADGYPGIIFQQSNGEARLLPKNKQLTSFFLYGQTIYPIELYFEGAYRLIVFQLYPFVPKTLFDVNPKELNGDCYDLHLLNNVDVKAITKQLADTHRSSSRVGIIATFLSDLLEQTVNKTDQKIALAINLILSSNGTITVKALRENLNMTERTLQRLFIGYVGISPKQFSKIIQFQHSLNQLSAEQYSKLTDIVYETGYADQPHFIRSFKKYTGKKPSQFKNQQ